MTKRHHKQVHQKANPWREESFEHHHRYHHYRSVLCDKIWRHERSMADVAAAAASVANIWRKHNKHNKKKTQHDSKQAQASAFFSMPQQIDIYNMAQMKAWQRGKWARETGKHNSPSWQKTRWQEEQSPTPKNTTTTTTNKNAKAWPPSTIKNKACKSMTRVANFYTRPPLAQGMPLLQRAWLTSW